MEKCLNEQLDDFGIYLDECQYQKLYDMMIKCSVGDNFKIDCSSGRSIIINIDNSDYVYQFYLNTMHFNTVLHNSELVKNLNGFVNIIDILYDYDTIIYEKLIPIYNIQDNTITLFTSLDQFYNDISLILYTLRLTSLVHGDFTCDNIGFSTTTNEYVLYDLETLKFNDNTCTDIYRVNDSLLFHHIIFSH